MLIAIALLFVTVSEASIGIFVKLVDGQIPILTLNFYRVFFAALFLLGVIALSQRTALSFPRRNIRDVLIIGALIATQISLFNIAMTLAPVANVVVFWSIAPFFVGIFSTIFLKERPRPEYALVFLLALVGIGVAEPVSLDFSSWSPEQLGNFIALTTGAVYAALVTYLRSEGKTESRVDILWFMVAASVYLSPALLIFGPGDLFAPSTTTLLGAPVPVLVWAAALGILSTGIAYYCISYVLRKINANIYALIDIIVSPIVAGALAFFVFTEVPSTRTLIGGAILLFSGAILTVLRNRAKDDDGATWADKYLPKRKVKPEPLEKTLK